MKIAKTVTAAALACVALSGVTAAPALAQDRYDRSYYEDGDGYRHEYRESRYRDDDGGYESYERRDVEYAPRDRYARGDYYRAPRRHYHRCGSGTTGAILGAALGGLLGREVGRGGPWDRPSTTGLIVGAGAGALAGRAIERDGCR